MRNNPSIKLAGFLNTIWKSAAEAMHRKKYIRQSRSSTRQAGRQTGGQAGGKKSFVSIRFSLCFWSLMTPELQETIVNHPFVSKIC